MSIIQWNCRGFRNNKEELVNLLNDNKGIAACLQETFMKEGSDFTVKGFNAYHKIGGTGERAAGGSSILVKKSIPQKQITLNTNIQAIAVILALHKTITLCSVYLPPNHSISKRDLNNLTAQLPSPFLLLGDFNAHSNLWGNTHTDRQGQIVEDFLSENNLCLLNDKSHTYLHPGHGTYSSIDLTISSPSIVLDLAWEVGDDVCGSDHFPILILIKPPLPSECSRRLAYLRNSV